MQASAKYLIHATVRTNGVVERSDVVGAIFGQTEGLLGDQLDLRDLQEQSKVGRIDVGIESEGGRSIGSITIASGLDRVETAVLAASLETMERVGPCRADCTVTEIEDARAAKRRNVIKRATELLDELEETTVTTEQIVEEVRKNARVAEITEYRGFPAGPHVESSDAIIIVEGRADVRRLLEHGIKNAVAVEGTDIPAEIAELTADRNTTAFLDGDRGGDLILRELQQVGEVEYVAFAPTGQSVEDLGRTQILSALRRKVPLEQVTDGQSPREVFGPTDVTVSKPSEDDAGGETTAASETGQSEDTSAEQAEATAETSGENRPVADGAQSSVSTPTGDGDAPAGGGDSVATTGQAAETDAGATAASASANDSGTDAAVDESTSPASTTGVDADAETETSEAVADEEAAAESSAAESADGTDPKTLTGHVEAVISGERETARFLDENFDEFQEVEQDAVFDAVVDTDRVPSAIVLDGELTQRILDGAAQRGVGQIVAADLGEFVKQPTDVRVRTPAEVEVDA